MPFFILTITIITAVSACRPLTGSDTDKKIHVFLNATVIDAVNGYREGQAIVVKDKTIIKAGPSSEIDFPSDATITDCTGKYIIPGLWDAHVHLTNTPAMRDAMFPLLIVNGITYVRDTAATLESILPLRDRARQLADSGGMAPSVYITGPHMDGLQLSWASSVSVATAEQVDFIINCLINAGVDELKVYDLIPPELALKVFAKAAEKGYNICAHVPLGMDVIEASNAGLSSMEHMYNLEMSCSADWDSLLNARQEMIASGTGKPGNELRQSIYRAQRLHSFKTQDEERRSLVLETLAKNNTWQVPTLAITAREKHRLFESGHYRSTFSYLPEPVRTEWLERAKKSSEQAPSDEGTAHALWAYDMVPRLVDAGIGIMAGTDMPLALLTPGFSLHEELALLVGTGLTPMQAIESATLAPAKYFGIEHKQGSIESNMRADLLILDQNPLEDIKNTRSINAVMKNGHLHKRDDLDRILQKLKNPDTY